MVVLDTTIMIIALPSAQHALGFSNADRQWVVTAYTLAFGGFLLLGGRHQRHVRPQAHADDRRGRASPWPRPSAGPPRPPLMLIGARGLQGLFGALLAPSVLSLLTSTFTDPRERGRAFGIYATIAIAGVGLRAHPRRLPDPVRRLALVPLRQPAHRRRWSSSGPSP